jgi:molybdenum cofactor cytidylyltransferase
VVSGAVDVTVSARQAGGPDVVVVHNPAWAQGQATSLRAGLARCEQLGCTAAVIGLGDQPLVGAAAWATVARSETAPVVTATYDGRRSPPVRLDRSVWALVEASGDEGARALMRRRPELVAEVACDGDPSDVDTLEDLDRARSAAARPPRPGEVPGSGPDGQRRRDTRE